MIKYIFRQNKDYSRFNIIKQFTNDLKLKNDIYILLPFSKNQFFKNFFKRDRIINDFFISNYDTYVYDRKKITNKNPRAWWKFFQDWFNFKFSKYILSDTYTHFKYWEKLFGKYNGELFVLPVLADKQIYYPSKTEIKNEKIKILFYGSFIPLHGIDIILEAFSLMEKNNIPFEAKIIGTGQMYNKMKELYNKLNLKCVQMDGLFIDEKSLAQEIREHDIILGIFGDSLKARSVVPNKVYQALACKKAVVTLHSEPIFEFFDENDMITCERDSSKLSEKLIELINNHTLLENIATNGYEKFLKIYDTTESDFKEFINKIDNKLEK